MQARAMGRMFGWVAGLGCLLAATGAAAAPPSGLVVSDVTVVSPERATPLEHAYVRIVDGRIVAISQTPLSGDREIDGKQRFLVPGLIDSHVHLAVAPEGFPAPMTPEQAAAYPEIVAAALAQDPRSYLFFGFTSLADLYGTAQRTARWNALDIRPDAYFCGGATIYEGSYYRVLGPVFSYDRPVIFDPRQHTPEEIAVSAAAEGARCLKFGRNSGEPTTVAQGRALVDAAHASGLPVFFHANAKEPQSYAAAVGVDVIAHGMWNGHATGDDVLDDEAREILAAVARAGIGYQPTFQVLVGEIELFHQDYLARPELADVYPRALIDWYAHAENPFADRLRTAFRDRGLDADANYARTLSFVSQATGILSEAGGLLLFGTDTPSAWTYANPPGLNGRLEMDRWIAAGISEAKLFRALTIDNARALGLDGDIGTVEVGKIANLLLLGGNPLETVKAYDAIDIVILHGVPIERETLSARTRD